MIVGIAESILLLLLIAYLAISYYFTYDMYSVQMREYIESDDLLTEEEVNEYIEGYEAFHNSGVLVKNFVASTFLIIVIYRMVRG